MYKEKESFSIIICCYNAAKRLPITLEHLSKLDTSGVACELIIVDNNSNDNTYETVSKCWEEFGNPFDLVHLKQPLPGKTNAWHLGVINAKGNFIVMCDDDNLLPMDYLQKIPNVFRQKENIAMVGVKSVGIFDEKLPDWFSSISGSWAVGSQYNKSGNVTNEHNKLWGAGATFTRESLMKLDSYGYKQKFNGLKKEGMAEDHELFILLRLIGFEMYYCDEIEIKHVMPKGRITWQNYLEFIRLSGLNNWKFDAYGKVLSKEVSFKLFIQSGALYQIYLVLLILIEKRKLIRYFFKKPEEGASKETVNIYLLKYRALGLVKSIFKYRKEVLKFQQSSIATMNSGIN